MDPERIDLPALDPSRAELRWERLVRSVTARTRRRPDLRDGLLSLSRPALAVAAVFAALAWIPAALPLEEARDTTESPESEVTVLADFAAEGASAAAADWYLSQEGYSDVRE